MTAEFKRLGKRGSYRLGQLRAQGIRHRPPPSPLTPWFGRPAYRGPAYLWLLGLLLGAIAMAAGASLGWWFLPFAVGVAAGLVNRFAGWPVRFALPAVAVTAAAGWGLPLWMGVLRHQPYGAVARVIAAVAGLPAHAAVGIGFTLLIAVVQAIVGYWLGRAVTPQPSRE
jgi:hypothetical protein